MAPKIPSAHTLPFLTLLRLLLGLHLLVSALSSYTPFAALTPTYVPLFLLISGFNCAYNHALSSFPHAAFFARRFAAIYPLYLVSLVLHAVFLSTEQHSVRRALLAALFLTPYLPADIAFSLTDAPFLAQNLIPAVALCTLVFPAVISLFPRPTHPSRQSIAILTVSAYALTLLQTFWLSHLPGTPAAPRAVSLVDIAAFIPFRADVPAFFLGMLLALRRLSSPAPTLRNAIVSCLFSLSLFLGLALATSLQLSSVEVGSFAHEFLLRSALLPPFSLLVYSLSAFKTPQMSNFPSLTAGSYTAYTLAAPLWRLLGQTLCTGPAAAAQSLCRQPLPSISLSYLSWLPWHRTPTAAFAVESRASEESLLPDLGVLPVLFFPVLMSVSAAAYCFIQGPSATAIPVLYSRFMAMYNDGGLGTRIMEMFRPKNVAPRRNGSVLERTVSVITYYLAGAVFLVFVFRFSSPISYQIAAANPISMLCFFPSLQGACERPEADASPLEGLRGQIGIGSALFTRILSVVRWIAIVTLPAMLLNVIAHAIFPRAIWRRLPTVASMLQGYQPDSTFENIERGLTAKFDEPVGMVHECAANFSFARSMKRLLDSGNGREAALSEHVDLNFVLYMRYVTRGNNPRLIANNVVRAVEILTESGLPWDMWRVEVVTDESIHLARHISDNRVYEIVVPKNYQTPGGALFKARALNYAISASPAHAQDWIVHLDEETRFDEDTIRAILYHCGRESHLTFVAKTQKWPRIGQGLILFGRAMTDTDITSTNEDGNWLTTLADSGRVSDDCGRYRLQYECGEVWVGMHGSFVVVSNAVEQNVTFDHGAEGSIAEDAYFALVARSHDVRFAWVDALMFEQSPFTVTDFVKQRARWLVGGLRVVHSSRIPCRVRLVMMCLTTTWALMPLTYVVFLLMILFGTGDTGNKQDELYFHILLPLLTAVSLWNYALGFFVTFSAKRMGFIRFAVLLYAQLVLSPIFGLMEVASVSYALWKMKSLATGFHVVQKEHAAVGRSGQFDGQASDAHIIVGEPDERTRLL